MGFEVGTYEFQTGRSTEYFLLGLILRPQRLKNSVESDHESFFVGFVFGMVVEDTFGGEHESYGRGVVGFEVVGAAEYEIVGY